MGKIRIKTFGDESLEEQEKKKKGLKRSEKKAREAAEQTEEKTVEPEVEVKEVKSKNKKFSGGARSRSAGHSQKYQNLLQLIDRTKTYALGEALDLLEKLQRKNLPRRQGGFDETVELHLNTLSADISGNITLPHGTGKKTKVAIATDALITEIEKGIINFDILVAEPNMMGKLAKVAKILGPKGLMPNPKNGTITEKPEEVAKKYEGGQINFKTETKTPIMHLTVGKVSFGKGKLTENIESLISAVKKSNIVNATLKSTMSPGIKIKI